MGFNLNYRKLWECLKAEAELLHFKSNDPNERLIMEVASKFILKEMARREAAQREEVEQAKRLFNINTIR